MPKLKEEGRIEAKRERQGKSLKSIKKKYYRCQRPDYLFQFVSENIQIYKIVALEYQIVTYFSQVMDVDFFVLVYTHKEQTILFQTVLTCTELVQLITNGQINIILKLTKQLCFLGIKWLHIDRQEIRHEICFFVLILLSRKIDSFTRIFYESVSLLN